MKKSFEIGDLVQYKNLDHSHWDEIGIVREIGGEGLIVGLRVIRGYTIRLNRLSYYHNTQINLIHTWGCPNFHDYITKTPTFDCECLTPRRVLERLTF